MVTQRRVHRQTLKSLRHIKAWAPVCPQCGERVYSLTDNLHKGMTQCLLEQPVAVEDT